MIHHTGKKIVILGMMTKMPVAGNIWLVLHYLLGLRRLGHTVSYVEAHGRTPTMLMRDSSENASLKAADFLGNLMKRFDLDQNWAFHAVHDDGACYGMSELKLKALYETADLIINLHAGTLPRPEHTATGRLILLETDPVDLQVELHRGDEAAIRFLEPHVKLFSWGENYRSADCRVPMVDRFHFHPTRAPVIQDLWEGGAAPDGSMFTTIGNWRQPWREVKFEGEVYQWSKHYEFMKVIDLPKRCAQRFELALGSYTDDDRRMLELHGWSTQPAMDFSLDLHAYRDYIRASRGEFTVAKDQNVRLRSGWFSERSAQYLAAGRPVITQETGFSNILPTGRGLFAFSTIDDILAAVDTINTDYEKHCRAASELARQYFNYDVVLPRLLEEAGL